MRKKAYLVKLKELVDEIDKQTQCEEKERKVVGERILNMDAVKRQSVLLFLSYRAGNMQDRSKWELLLDEAFTFTLPITPYRAFLKTEVKGSCRTVTGMDGVIRDSASIALMLQTLGQGNACWREGVLNGTGCKFTYYVARDDILVAGDLAMCRYLLKVDGCEKLGSDQACYQPGMLQCRFCPQTNKIVHAEMVFDVMGFMQQLQVPRMTTRPPFFHLR